MLNTLDFEQPIVELDQRIASLYASLRQNDSDEDKYLQQINQLKKKRQSVIKNIYSQLSAWQIAKLARHPQRPYSLDYIEHIFSDFVELHGDRMFADDAAIIGGIGRLEERAVMVIGHQKGRDTEQKIKRNFGMSRPEGYRKAKRLAKLAEQFRLPLVTFVDTPGAYPGIDAENRGQAEAIAENLLVFSQLETPIVSTVIGEGGSGGALAIGVCDYLMMLEYSTYAVISPEGCASILWKSAEKAADAAQAMGLTSADLFKQGLIDEIVEEPAGGSHRNHAQAAQALKRALIVALDKLSTVPLAELLATRYQKIRGYGAWTD